ncbi:MAG: hypothetical protein ACSHW0_06540 [Thalassotalea sp.]
MNNCKQQVLLTFGRFSALFLLLFFPSVAHASYLEGFFAFVMLVVAIPIVLIFFIGTLFLLNRNRFHQRQFTFNYCLSWFIALKLVWIASSVYSLKVSDQESPLILLAGFIIFYLIIVLPGVFQYKSNSRDKADMAVKSE